MTRWAALLAALAFLIAVPLFHFGRSYPWSPALIISAAIGALTYSVVRTGYHLRDPTVGDRPRIGVVVEAEDGEKKSPEDF